MLAGFTHAIGSLTGRRPALAAVDAGRPARTAPTAGAALAGPRSRIKVLFVAESVTLAHVARPAVLARSLDPGRYEVVIAAHPRTWGMLAGIGARLVPLDSISGARFTAALAAGKPVYDVATLRAYIDEDLRLLASERPDVVVGDFRLSLGTSARLAGVPYAAIVNAHWSPWAPRRAMPCPVVTASRLPVIGAMARLLGPIAVPIGMRSHAGVFARVRRERGVPVPEHGLRGEYTDADLVLYADAPGLADLGPLPANHRCIGVPLWSPPIPAPTWVEDLERAGKRWIYVTLGSSGDPAQLPMVIAGLRGCGLPIAVATAGAELPADLPPGVHAAPYLPGERMATGAALVVCNGGNTAQQALAGGAPVLAIAGNLDQFLHMGQLERRGCGRILRADTATSARVAAAAAALLADPAAAAAAAAARDAIRAAPVARGFAAALSTLTQDAARAIAARTAQQHRSHDMRILVTGGAGFIGRRTVRALLDAGHQVRVLDNLDPQIHGPGATAPAELDPRAEFLRGSVEDPAAVDAAIAGVDAVYHLAALTGVGQSMYDLADYTRVTVGGTAVLLDRLMRRSQPLKRLVLSSSRAIYGEGAARCPTHGTVHPGPRNPADLAAGFFGVTCPQCGADCAPISTPEGTAPAPASIYAWTKLQQEELCRQVARVHPLPVTILRYFNVYGEGQSLRNPYTGVVAIFAARLRAGRGLAIYERNRPLRDFVHVADVVQANLRALDAAVPSGTAINIGTGDSLTIGDLAHALGAAIGVEARCEDTGEYRIGDILACVADRSQAATLLGWRPEVALADGLGRFAAWAATQEAVDGSDRAAAELRQRGLLAQVA